MIQIEANSSLNSYGLFSLNLVWFLWTKNFNNSVTLLTQRSSLDKKVVRGIVLDIEHKFEDCSLEELDEKIDEKLKEEIKGLVFNGKIEIKKGNDSYIVIIGYDPINE